MTPFVVVPLGLIACLIGLDRALHFLFTGHFILAYAWYFFSAFTFSAAAITFLIESTDA